MSDLTPAYEAARGAAFGLAVLPSDIERIIAAALGEPA